MSFHDSDTLSLWVRLTNFKKKYRNTGTVNGNGYAPPSPSTPPLSARIIQRASTEYLSDRLDEAESGRRKQEGLRQNLEWVRPSISSSYPNGQLMVAQAVEQLRKDLKDMAREKTEVLARLESQKPVREYNIVYPPRHNVRQPEG